MLNLDETPGFGTALAKQWTSISLGKGI